MICARCKTIIGYTDDGSDQSHVSCEAYGCGSVFCEECEQQAEEQENHLFHDCDKCGVACCWFCAYSVRDPENDQKEIGIVCETCGELIESNDEGDVWQISTRTTESS